MEIDFKIPQTILTELLGAVVVPPTARVRYIQPTPAPIDNLEAVLLSELARQNASTMFRPGQQVAVGVGSRGIDRLPAIVSTLIAALKSYGVHPYVFPAMGSHGGATAEGQREILANLGITAERIGVPIESQMETAVIGHTAEGIAVHMDRTALAADAIVFVARIKPHTAFHGPYESGLAKMMAIGIGKQAGAAATHAAGFSVMDKVVPAVAEVALAKAPIRFAVGVLENAHDRIFKISLIPADRMMSEEPGLLTEARAAMPKIPYSNLDVLVIDRIGKNISGDGADPNVTGRYPTPYAHGGPDVSKQVILDLSAASGGNANGMGTADFITTRLAEKVDLAATYPNALTSTVAGPVKIPMMLPSDRLAIAAAILTSNAVGREPRLLRIQDTLNLGEFWISPALLTEAESDRTQTVIAPPASLPFDSTGNLQDIQTEDGVRIAVGHVNDSW